jgi:hypothetical protein
MILIIIVKIMTAIPASIQGKAHKIAINEL